MEHHRAEQSITAAIRLNASLKRPDKAVHFNVVFPRPRKPSSVLYHKYGSVLLSVWSGVWQWCVFFAVKWCAESSVWPWTVFVGGGYIAVRCFWRWAVFGNLGVFGEKNVWWEECLVRKTLGEKNVGWERCLVRSMFWWEVCFGEKNVWWERCWVRKMFIKICFWWECLMKRMLNG